MKRFLIKTIFLSSIIFVLLSVLGIVVDAGLRKSRDNEYCEIYNGGINADLLICGSSRAWVHISPQIIDSAFNINSYNIGLDGQPFLMQIAKYSFYRESNNKPKYIIYAVDNISLNKRKDIYNINLYLPFLNNETLAQTLQKHSGYNLVDYYNPFTKYAYKKGSIKWGILQFFNIKYSEPYYQKVKGYQGLVREWDNSFDNFKKQNPNGFEQKYDKEVFDAFEQFVKVQRKDDVKIIFVWTPQYIEYTEMLLNKKEALNFYTGLSDRYNIPFLDYSTDTICYNKSYFYNSQHLNKAGSELFTKKLVHDIDSLKIVK